MIAITQEELKSIQKLEKKQDALMAQVKELNSSLAHLEKVIAKTANKLTQKTPRPKSTRVLLDKKIEAGLKRAGKKGISLPELAKLTNSHLPSIRTWFATKAKKVRQVKRISRGTYQWVGR